MNINSHKRKTFNRNIFKQSTWLSILVCAVFIQACERRIPKPSDATVASLPEVSNNNVTMSCYIVSSRSWGLMVRIEIDNNSDGDSVYAVISHNYDLNVKENMMEARVGVDSDYLPGDNTYKRKILPGESIVQNISLTAETASITLDEYNFDCVSTLWIQRDSPVPISLISSAGFNLCAVGSEAKDPQAYPNTAFVLC